MGQPTQKYNRSLSGSIGAGMKSIMGGSGRRYYVLEHKVSTKYHRAGENQRIIVDQIELGRDPRCQVRFDESFGTVSRRHAAIVKDGDNWKLVQLSKTNSTYLNGHKVENEWYLQNGDEIQLSTNGPKMGFIVPEGDRGLVKSIGLSQRLSLFRQQALRPYKQAIAVLSAVFVICAAAGTYMIVNMHGDLKQKSQEIATLIDESKGNKVLADSLANELVATNQQMDDYKQNMDKLAKDAKAARSQALKAQKDANEAKRLLNERGGVASEELKAQCFPHTYAVYQVGQKITQPDGEVIKDDDVNLVGSGFLLSDGRFVTARHVVETHYYWNSDWPEGMKELLMLLNAVANNGGSVETNFVAVSNSGDRISFSSRDCQTNRNGDDVHTATLESGMTIVLKAAADNGADWATYRTSKSGLPYDATTSENMPIGTTLQILGFPYGRGGENPSAISPILSHAEVARDGLDTDGTIMTSNDDTQSGNSGGPVFMYKDGAYHVIGILSGSTAGKGRVVPINRTR